MRRRGQGRVGGSTHASGADSLFRKLSGRSPGGTKLSPSPGQTERCREPHGRDLLPDMGRPRLLPLLLLLVQTCVPGRDSTPKHLRGELGPEHREEGRGGGLGAGGVEGGGLSPQPSPSRSDPSAVCSPTQQSTWQAVGAQEIRVERRH